MTCHNPRKLMVPIETGTYLDPAAVDALHLIGSRVADDRWFEAHPDRRYFSRFTSGPERRVLYRDAVPVGGDKLVLIVRRNAEGQIERRLALRFQPIKEPHQLSDSDCARLWHAHQPMRGRP